MGAVAWAFGTPQILPSAFIIASPAWRLAVCAPPCLSRLHEAVRTADASPRDRVSLVRPTRRRRVLCQSQPSRGRRTHQYGTTSYSYRRA